MELILAALGAGAVAAAKDTAGKAVKDTYEGLKTLIKKRFADKGKADDSNIIDKHEKKPDSKAVKALLEEELIDVEVDQDAEIQKIAEQLMELLKAEQSGSASSKHFTTNIQAKNVASQTGDRNQQDNQFS